MAKSSRKKSSPKNAPLEKVGNSTNPVEHFEIIGGKRKIIKSTGRVINLAQGIPADALDLYISGKFPYLGLKPGAEVLFSDASEMHLKRLITNAPRKEDVVILKKALKKS